MESLNKKFAQLEAPYQPCMTIKREDTKPISTMELESLLSGYVVISGVNNKGQANYIPASKYWRGNTDKTIYRKITFTNKEVSVDTYNLFSGFGTEPKKGNCDLIISHVKDVICSGNEENYNAFNKKVAWEIQNIGEPSRVVVILKSIEQQTGKGVYFENILLPIYGNSGFKPAGLEQVIGRFNDTMKGKAFVYLDEVLFAGDLRSADSLKSLTTAKFLGIETKNVAVIQAPVGINFYLTTNHENAAHIEELDDRYWILEVSTHKKGDTEYFKLLFEEINNGGLEAYHYYLTNLDVKDFVPWRDVPKDNEFKNKMIKDSINPYDARKWIEQCCEAEMILGLKPIRVEEFPAKSNYPWEPWVKGIKYENGFFQVAYADWQKTVKSPVAPRLTATNTLGKLLNDLDFVEKRDVQRYRTLPDVTDCLNKLKEMEQKKVKRKV